MMGSDPMIFSGRAFALNGAMRMADHSDKQKPFRRRLCAILVADVVGYTRLTEIAEEDTHRRLMLARTDVIAPQIAAGGGRIVKSTGDGFMATFDTATEAAHCAISLQLALKAASAHVPSDLRLTFRMSVNLADIIIEDDDVFGDGVNIAARLQSYAEPGDVIVSEPVFNDIQGTCPVTSTDLGELHLRNHEKPVRVYSLRAAADSLPPRVKESTPDADARASIAVLPFRINAPGPNESYFADGIIDSIIHTLSGLKDLFVISRGSTLAYGRRRADPTAIGRKLGVRYIMKGGVWRAKGRVRIRTELIDTEKGVVVSADQYEDAEAELFSLQDRISLNIIRAIAPHIRELELRRAMRKHPQSMTAYDLLLQALDLLYKMDRTSFSKARGLLQEAMALDPSYAAPYTYAALWHVFRVGEFDSPDPEADARAAAERALAAIERDGNDALALAIYGHVQAYLMHDHATARRLLDRAIEAGPSMAMAWTMSGAMHGFSGNGPLAVMHAQNGVRLAPTDPYTFWHEGLLAQAHYVNGDYDQALKWALSAVALNPSIRFTLRILAASFAAKENWPSAREAGTRLLALQPSFRLSSYARRCPFAEPALSRWLTHLRQAGLPA
jgi:adenylate cyclase